MCIRDRAIRDNSILSENLQDEVEADLTLGQRLAAVSYTHLDVYKRQVWFSKGFSIPFSLPTGDENPSLW